MTENIEVLENVVADAVVVEEQTTDGDWNEAASSDEPAKSDDFDLVSVDEAKAIFAENPGVSCVLTVDGRLFREGYFA